MAVPARTTLQNLIIIEPGYATTADDRFYAYEVTSKSDGTYWIVKDNNGWFFKGDNGRVGTLEAADSYVTAWVSQLTKPGVTHLVLSTPRYAETRDGRFYATRDTGAWTVRDQQGQFQSITCDDLAYADHIIGEITAEPAVVNVAPAVANKLEAGLMTCRRCRRPADLHCPGCTTCWPDYSCAPTCDAELEEVAAAAEAVEQWETTHAALIGGAA